MPVRLRGMVRSGQCADQTMRTAVRSCSAESPEQKSQDAEQQPERETATKNDVTAPSSDGR